MKSPGQGTFSVADPRGYGADTHKNVFRVVPWESAAGVVSSGHGPSSGGQAVADPLGGRLPAEQHGKYRMTAWDEAARAVISGNANGAYAVADPRPGMAEDRAYLTAGHYGVVDPAEPSGAVSAAACHDNGRWSVADWRLPEATDKLVCVIRALDGTWHRPFTTLDLAALQSLYDPDDYAEAAEQFVLHGSSDQAWRERIGNAVPKKAGKAMAEEIGRAILLSRAGESFQLSGTPIWVRPIATALAVRGGEAA